MASGPVPSERDPGSEFAYKYQRVRELLRQAVQSGEWTGKLPGERELARRYQANAKTINKALSDLATEGLLVRHVGRGTFAAGRPDAAPQAEASGRMRKFGFLAPSEDRRDCAESFFARLSAALRSAHHRLEPFDAQPANGLVTVRPEQLRDCHGLIACGRVRLSDSLIATLQRRHLPLLILNNTHERVRTAAVVIDYGQAAFELCQHLVHCGARQVHLCVDADLLPAAHQAEVACQAVLRSYGIEPQPARVIASPDDLPAVNDGQGGAASGFLCVGTWPARLLLERRQPAGAAAPGLSLCCVCEPGNSWAGQNSVTSYEVQSEAFLNWVTELAVSASPARWQRVVVVPGRLVDRGSAARGLRAGPAARSAEAVII